MNRIFYANITFACNNRCANCISHSVRGYSNDSLSVNDFRLIDEKFNKQKFVRVLKSNFKYSTIVVYDGAQYKIRASNVDQKHWDTLKNLAIDPVFSDSIKTATPKYITVDNDNEKLPYQKMEFGRAKCAIFFPLYIDNVYIGYWIIEGSIPHLH